MPGTVALELYRGDWSAWRVRLWEDAERTVPYDLTGFTAAAQLRDKPGGMQVVDLAVAITLPNIVDVEMTAELWATAPASGAWDLEITDPAGHPMTPVAGPVRITPDITVVAAP